MRNYKKKTNRGEVPKEVYVAAAREIMEENKHLRPVADKYGINFMTLQRYVKRCRNFKVTGNNNNNTYGVIFFGCNYFLEPIQIY